MFKASLVINEVLPYYEANPSSSNPTYPKDKMCKSGHLTPDGVRFFQVSGDTLSKDRWGVYCELCLKVANRMIDRKRKLMGDI